MFVATISVSHLEATINSLAQFYRKDLNYPKIGIMYLLQVTLVSVGRALNH